jgi:hypothetical protein
MASEIPVEVFGEEPQQLEVELLGIQLLNEAGQCCIVPPGIER